MNARGRFFILFPLALFVLIPFVWMLQTALKQDADLYNFEGVPFLFQMAPTLKNVTYLLFETQFLRWFGNSLMVGIIVACITVVLSTLGGYSLSRYNFPLSNAMGIGMFISYLVPQALIFIPLARVMTTLQLQDSLLALILIYPTLTVPFCTWFMMGYFRSIPRQLDEAARMDGADTVQILRRVIVPLAMPGILTVFLYAFVMTWQEYLYAVTLISTPTSKTLPVAATTELVRGDVFFWGSLMSATLIGSLPTILIFSFFSKHFISGITHGAVK